MKSIMKTITQSKSVVQQVLDLLYKNKTVENQPLKLEIKLRSTATPDEQLDINQWHQLIHNMNNKKSQTWNSGQLVKTRPCRNVGPLLFIYLFKTHTYEKEHENVLKRRVKHNARNG